MNFFVEFESQNFTFLWIFENCIALIRIENEIENRLEEIETHISFQ